MSEESIEFTVLPEDELPAFPALPPDAFRRLDQDPDTEFYREPRFVTHIDDAAIAAVTGLYRRFFPAGSALLDLMSSWVSHLPPEIEYPRIAGLGLNAEELGANPRLTESLVQDLNVNPILPFGDHEFDGCAICVSIDYLVRPIDVLREVRRVLTPGGRLVITFSNRCFPTKAVAAWQVLNDGGHVRLVRHYLGASGPWREIEALKARARSRGSDPLYGIVAAK